MLMISYISTNINVNDNNFSRMNNKETGAQVLQYIYIPINLKSVYFYPTIPNPWGLVILAILFQYKPANLVHPYNAYLYSVVFYIHIVERVGY